MRFTSKALALITCASLLAAPARAQFKAPPLEPGVGWINTDEPLRLDDQLQGHIVLIDFWTFCCINCIHVLPDLEYLEERFADEPFVVIGVHSAKFENEAKLDSVRDAVRRYHIKHPVIVDRDFSIWRSYGARAWPTLVLIGADGVIIGSVSGEGHRDTLEQAIEQALRDSKSSGALAKKQFKPKLDEPFISDTGLSFPGKIAIAPPTADKQGALFIADSSNNRVIHTSWPDEDGDAKVITIYGNTRGFTDGSANTAQFNDPQGMVLTNDRSTLYVADTKNHAIRAIDLNTQLVTTLVGDGVQGRDRSGGKRGRKQRLASPWDLELSPDNQTLYIAMAGTHQLWSANTTNGLAKVIAGSGREDIIDARASAAALAQPSGLALSSDASRLYFADSEVSGIRYLDLDANRVVTIIGKGLFEFGDTDGDSDTARLQHALGIATVSDDGKDRLIIADTYNDKLKWIDPDAKRADTWRPDSFDAPKFDLEEPAGIEVAMIDGAPIAFVADTNSHRILRINLNTGAWIELAIEGVNPD